MGLKLFLLVGWAFFWVVGLCTFLALVTAFIMSWSCVGSFLLRFKQFLRKKLRLLLRKQFEISHALPSFQFDTFDSIEVGFISRYEN